MGSRRGLLKFIYMGLTTLITSFMVVSCGAKPDAETEPSPEWPPKDEE